MGVSSDSNRELQDEIQFVKVSTTRQFVSESRIIPVQYYKTFKTKTLQPSASNFLKKSKTLDNMKYIILPSAPSVDESYVERFLKVIRGGPVYFCVVCNISLYKSNVVLFKEKK